MNKTNQYTLYIRCHILILKFACKKNGKRLVVEKKLTYTVSKQITRLWYFTTNNRPLSYREKQTQDEDCK